MKRRPSRVSFLTLLRGYWVCGVGSRGRQGAATSCRGRSARSAARRTTVSIARIVSTTRSYRLLGISRFLATEAEEELSASNQQESTIAGITVLSEYLLLGYHDLLELEVDRLLVTEGAGNV